MDVFTSKLAEEAVIGVVKREAPPLPANVTMEEPVWKPTNHQLLIMISLSITSLMISLDATIVITSLTVWTHC